MNFYSKKGFSLAEIVISIALLGIIIVIISGVFVHGLHAIKKSKYRVVAMNIADKKCSELRYLFLSNLSPITADTISNEIYGTHHVSGDFSWGIGSTPVQIEGEEKVDNTVYRFFLDISEEGTVVELKKVNVRVSWDEVEDEREVNISTFLSRPPVYY